MGSLGPLGGNLALGLATAVTVQNLFYCFVGVLLGTLIGVLPGIGPVATIAMLLPITYALPPTAALIMLAGIYYGAQYGGSTTAILVNLPGEASSVVTCLDGYQMARQGRAGPALAIAAIGSFIAGTVCDPDLRAAGGAAGCDCHAVRAGGIFLADGARAHRRRRDRQSLGAEGDRHGGRRLDPGAGRHRREQRRPALYLRRDRAARRHRLHRRGGRRIRRDRDRDEPREEGNTRSFHRQGRQPDAEPRAT